jgi:hypothetical protein
VRYEEKFPNRSLCLRQLPAKTWTCREGGHILPNEPGNVSSARHPFLASSPSHLYIGIWRW